MNPHLAPIGPRLEVHDRVRPLYFPGDSTCHELYNHCTHSIVRCRVRMKGTLGITSLGVFLLLGFCFAVLCARADTIYLSTANLNSILRVDSSANESTFATAGSGLNYPLGLAFDSSGNLYVANAGSNVIEEFGSGGTGSVFATATSGLDGPIALAVDSGGNLYVANYSGTILKFNKN